MSWESRLSLSGVGTLQSVCSEHCSQMAENNPSINDTIEIVRRMENLLGDGANTMAALALACAVMNTQFKRTGWLFEVDCEKCVRASIPSDGAIKISLLATLAEK